MFVDIAPGGIRKIQLYTTSKWGKKTVSQVRKATGADVVINGTLYNPSTWKPLCDVKQSGKVLSDDAYSYRGLAWNDSDGHFTPTLSVAMGQWDNFISCVMLVNDGKALPISCTPDVKRSAGRTAIIGFDDGTVRLWCVKEGARNQTPTQLQNSILAMGKVKWALMLDGGGSSQLSQEGSSYVYSTRKVQNYICFWLRDPEPKGAKPMEAHCKSYSLKKQGTVNLSAHFRVKEFACKDGSDTVWIADELVDVLESIRAQAGGKALNITSGYRTAAYNTKVGGAEYSQHCYGTAADIYIKGVGVDTLAKYARVAMPERGGVGIYVKQGFVHVDTRTEKVDWVG